LFLAEPKRQCCLQAYLAETPGYSFNWQGKRFYRQPMFTALASGKLYRAGKRMRIAACKQLVFAIAQTYCLLLSVVSFLLSLFLVFGGSNGSGFL